MEFLQSQNQHEVIIISASQLFFDEEIYENAASERIMKTKSYLSNGAKILRHCRIASIYFATFLRTQSTLHLEIQYLFVDTKKAIFFLSQNYFVVSSLSQFHLMLGRGSQFCQIKVESEEEESFQRN